MLDRLDLTLAYPRPVCDVLVSLPVNMVTAMVLVDIVQRGDAPPTPWPRALHARLAEPVQRQLETVEALLAHGVVLRDFLLRKLAVDHPAHDDWSTFRGWLSALSSADLVELIAHGIVRGVERYRARDVARPEVDTHLAPLAGRPLSIEDLRDTRRRVAAARALLAGWNVAQPDSALALVVEPDRLRTSLLSILEAVWQEGYCYTWSATRDTLQQSAARARASASRTEGILGAEELVLRATGLQPASDVAESVRRAERIVFVPCLHLGPYLAVHEIEGTRYVLYSPEAVSHAAGIPEADPAQTNSSAAQLLEPDKLEAALLALGDPTRLAILVLLAEHGELNAQQIAESLRVHSSTVSRNLAQLEQAVLVYSRRETGVKRYRLARDRIRQVSTGLSEKLG